MKITPTQARQVLTGTKTRHRIKATRQTTNDGRGNTQRHATGAPRIGSTIQIPGGQALVTSRLLITAGYTAPAALRHEAHHTPLAMKLDWLRRYDPKWLNAWHYFECSDQLLHRYFDHQWGSRDAWLITLEPAPTARFLLAGTRSADYTTVPTDPLDAGEAADPGSLRPEWSQAAKATHRDARTDRAAKNEAWSVARLLREELVAANRRGRDTTGPIERIRRELDALREDRAA